MSKKRFWMCVMDNVFSGRYPSKTEVNNEAKRLAALNSGLAVYVLEATHCYQVVPHEPQLFITQYTQSDFDLDEAGDDE